MQRLSRVVRRALVPVVGLALVGTAGLSAPTDAAQASRLDPDEVESGSTPAAATLPPRLAIGVPGRDIGREPDAGVVELRTASGKTQVISAPDARAGDRFGTTVAMHDLNGDEIDDLIVGAPGRDVAGENDSGAVYYFLGTPDGVRCYQVRTLGDAEDAADQAGAEYGSALSVNEDFDGIQILAGAPSAHRRTDHRRDHMGAPRRRARGRRPVRCGAVRMAGSRPRRARRRRSPRRGERRGLVMFAVPRGPGLTLTYGTAMAGDGYGSALAAGT